MNRVSHLFAVLIALTPPVGCASRPSESANDTSGDTGRTEGVDHTQPETTVLVRRYPEDGRPRDHDEAVQVLLDLDRARAYGVSRDDVQQALRESTILPARPIPPPGVVFVTHLASTREYEELVVKAYADGRVVRLKDLALVQRVRSE